jgi:hypothetical protein
MASMWILNADESPIEASKSGEKCLWTMCA